MGRLFLAGMASAALAYLLNRALDRCGRTAAIYWGPFLEEAAKTGLALAFRASVPGTHMVFGALEAVRDFAAGGVKKTPASLAGLAAHTVFGLVTYYLISAGAPAYLAVMAAAALHAGWNAVVLKLSRSGRPPG